MPEKCTFSGLDQKSCEVCDEFPKGLRDTKILIAHKDVAGIFSSLSMSLRKHGFNAEFVSRLNHRFGYIDGEETKHLLINVSRTFSKRKRSANSAPLKILFGVLSRVVWDFWCLLSFFSYKCFIFTGGQSFWPLNLDLILLKMMGKKLVIHAASGSESRPPWMNGKYQKFDTKAKPSARKLVFISFFIKTRLSVSLFLADSVIGSPLSTGQFANRKFVNYLFVGMAKHTSIITSEGKSKTHSNVDDTASTTTSFFHAPSDPTFKGSMEIRNYLSALRDEGIDVTLKEKTGVRNHAILGEMNNCDVVVDQLFSDTPVSVIGMEAHSTGRVAAVSGYGWNKILPFLGHPNESLACFYVQPSDFYNLLKKLATDENFRVQTLRAQTQITQDFANLDKMTNHYLTILSGQVPVGWIYDPKDCDYFLGAGQHELVTKRQVAGIVAHFGERALGLSHNKNLLQKTLKFIE